MVAGLDLCAIGSWGDRRPSVVGYVTVTGGHGRGASRFIPSILPDAPSRSDT
jgi:hypothetical protein